MSEHVCPGIPSPERSTLKQHLHLRRRIYTILHNISKDYTVLKLSPPPHMQSAPHHQAITEMMPSGTRRSVSSSSSLQTSDFIAASDKYCHLHWPATSEKHCFVTNGICFNSYILIPCHCPKLWTLSATHTFLYTSFSPDVESGRAGQKIGSECYISTGPGQYDCCPAQLRAGLGLGVYNLLLLLQKYNTLFLKKSLCLLWFI